MGSTLITLSLMFEGVLSGVFLGSALIEHAERTLEVQEWIAYKQAKEQVFGRVMPPFFGMTVAISAWRTAFSASKAGPFAVTLLLVAALAITVLVHIPLNRAIQGWSQLTYPSGWGDHRRRWRRWNWARCFLVTCAFGLAATIGK